MTTVERVLTLKQIDLLSTAGPRQLLQLAELVREVEMIEGQAIYAEADLADAIYVVYRGRVSLVSGGKELSTVGPGEAFGTWALVDDSERAQSAVCTEEGLLVALGREEFYEFASGDPAVLQGIIRVLGRRLKALVVERPEESRIEDEGAEPEATDAADSVSDSGMAPGGRA
ncbi:MAG: cyclic nucleotide-binding domain-containing protein [Candidatus Eisenbacteria bacterium]